MKWFRFYSQVLHDSKVQTLGPEVFRAWVNLLCLASEHDERGALPAPRQVAFALRTNEARARTYVEALLAAGLLDRRADGTLQLHDWGQWQYHSDDVTERVRKHRNRKKETFPNGKGNVPETPRVRADSDPDPDPDSDSDSERERPPLSLPPDDEAVSPLDLSGITEDMARRVEHGKGR